VALPRLIVVAGERGLDGLPWDALWSAGGHRPTAHNWIATPPGRLRAAASASFSRRGGQRACRPPRRANVRVPGRLIPRAARAQGRWQAPVDDAARRCARGPWRVTGTGSAGRRVGLPVLVAVGPPRAGNLECPGGGLPRGEVDHPPVAEQQQRRPGCSRARRRRTGACRTGSGGGGTCASQRRAASTRATLLPPLGMSPSVMSGASDRRSGCGRFWGAPLWPPMAPRTVRTRVSRETQPSPPRQAQPSRGFVARALVTPCHAAYGCGRSGVTHVRRARALDSSARRRTTLEPRVRCHS